MGRQPLLLGRAAACLLIAAAPYAGRAQEAGGAVPTPGQPQPATPAASGERIEASEDIVVIGRLPQSPIPPSRVPAAVQVLDADELPVWAPPLSWALTHLSHTMPE